MVKYSSGELLCGDWLSLMPSNAEELYCFVEKVVGVSCPRVPVVSGHASPFDYLVHVFF